MAQRCRIFSYLLLWQLPVSLLAQTSSYAISRLAGGGLPPSPVAALSSGFDGAGGVAIDLAGNIYFTSGKRWIFRVSPAGVRTLIAGTGTLGYSGDGGPASSAQLNYPSGLAMDGAGNLYVADFYNHRVRKISAAGIITTVAGSGRFLDAAGNGGPAVEATVGYPYGLALDRSGGLLITSGGCACVRRVGLDGIITTVAGNGTSGFSGDGGPAVAAQFNNPRGVATDSGGNIYVADEQNHRLRRISSNGVISTMAGTGVQGSLGDGGPAVNAQLNRPTGLTVDSAGNVFVSEGLNPQIRKITPGGAISTFGSGRPAYYSSGLAVDPAGTLYAASGYFIRRVSAAGVVTVVAGNGTPAPAGDGGLALNGQLDTPTGIALDRAGNVYILEEGQEPGVRKVTPSGVISTVSSKRGYSFGMAVDGDGNVYLGEGTRVRRIGVNGTITIVAGTDTPGFSGDGGPALAARLGQTNRQGIALDANGNLFIADTPNHRIRRVSAGGIITTVAGGGTASPGDGAPAVNAVLSNPFAVAVDRLGNLYILEDQPSDRVRKVSPNGIITTLAALRPRTSARSGIVADVSGTVFFSDRATGIQMVSPDGKVSRIAGNDTWGYSGDGGPATVAALDNPLGLAVDRDGNVFVADSGNDVVRVLKPSVSLGITSLAPNTMPAGSPAFTLIVNGSGFSNGAVVLWNGLPLSTAFVNTNRLSALVPANLLLAPGNATVSVQNAGLVSDSLIFTIAVPISSGLTIITPSSLPAGSVGTTYAQGLSATGGATPYNGWSLLSGTLPPGLALTPGLLSGTALLSGTPTSAGNFSFAIQLTDNANATAIRQFTLGVTGGPVTLALAGIVNSASYVGGSVAPGEIVTIFGSFPGPVNLVTLQLDNRGYVATNLGGTQALFDSAAAPLIYAVAGQLSAIVPYGVTGKSSTQVQVSYQGQLSNSVALPVTPVVPGIFTADSSGHGQGAIVNQDGTVNSTSNPAEAGSIVFVYATGEGQTNPGGVDGKPSDAPAPTPTNQPVTATVGGLNAQVLYAGGVPGLVAGLLQVNIQLPSDVAPGSAVPVVLAIGGKSSQANVTFAIR